MQSLLDRDFVQGNVLDEIRQIRERLDRIERTALTGHGDLQVDDLEALGSFNYNGQLVVNRLGSDYIGSIFVPLTSALTCTDFDGDSFSTTSKTLVDLSADFGAPAGIRAVLLVVTVKDSLSAGMDTYLVLGPEDTDGVGFYFSPLTINDRVARYCAIVPCNADGDIYYQVVAGGSSTFDIYIRVWGYWY